MKMYNLCSPVNEPFFCIIDKVLRENVFSINWIWKISRQNVLDSPFKTVQPIFDFHLLMGLGLSDLYPWREFREKLQLLESDFLRLDPREPPWNEMKSDKYFKSNFLKFAFCYTDCNKKWYIQQMWYLENLSEHIWYFFKSFET